MQTEISDIPKTAIAMYEVILLLGFVESNSSPIVPGMRQNNLNREKPLL